MQALEILYTLCGEGSISSSDDATPFAPDRLEASSLIARIYLVGRSQTRAIFSLTVTTQC